MNWRSPAAFLTFAVSPALLAILAGLVLGAVVMAMTGNNPLYAYYEILRGAFEGPSLFDTLAWAVPLTGMTIVAALPLRGGMLNLGGDGQVVLGGLGAAMVALYLPAPGPVRLVASLLAAMLIAGSYAAFAAWGQVRWRVPDAISTLLLNYPAVGVASYLVRFPLRDVSTGMPETLAVNPSARLPGIGDTDLTSGIFLMAAVVAIVILVDRRTTAGFELRLRGLNTRFVGYGGVDLDRQAAVAMSAAGAIAGLVGAIVVVGMQYRFIDMALTIPNYTWTGLMAALLAGGEPVGAVAAALFFSVLQIGGMGMERATSISGAF